MATFKFSKVFRRLLGFHLKIFGGLIAGTVVITTFSTLVWALVVFGGRNQTRSLECSSRTLSKGFIGNSDFYGLGIRAGMYFQWQASLVAGDATQPVEKRNMVAAFALSSFALWVALLLLIFQRACAFTAEIIVILYLLYSGAYLVLWATVPSCNLQHKPSKAIKTWDGWCCLCFGLSFP